MNVLYHFLSHTWTHTYISDSWLFLMIQFQFTNTLYYSTNNQNAGKERNRASLKLRGILLGIHMAGRTWVQACLITLSHSFQWMVWGNAYTFNLRFSGNCIQRSVWSAYRNSDEIEKNFCSHDQTLYEADNTSWNRGYFWTAFCKELYRPTKSAHRWTILTFSTLHGRKVDKFFWY